MWNKLVIFLACVAIYFYKKSTASREGKTLQYYTKYFGYYLAYFLVSCLIWPFFLLQPKSFNNIKIILPIARLVSRIIDVKWDIRNSTVITQERPAVVVANHQSSLDVLGMFHLWQAAGKMTSIAKKELLYLMPFGLAAYLLGIIFIERRKPKNAYKQLDKAGEIMIRKKAKIFIFPEGTRGSGPELLPFKKGAFKLAVQQQVPIIPAVFSPYHFIDRQKRIFDKGTLTIQFLDEISTVGLTESDVPDLLDKVRDKMAAAYKQLSKEVSNKQVR